MCHYGDRTYDFRFVLTCSTSNLYTWGFTRRFLLILFIFSLLFFLNLACYLHLFLSFHIFTVTSTFLHLWFINIHLLMRLFKGKEICALGRNRTHDLPVCVRVFYFYIYGFEQEILSTLLITLRIFFFSFFLFLLDHSVHCNIYNNVLFCQCCLLSCLRTMLL